jgi:hypothetical protein
MDGDRYNTKTTTATAISPPAPALGGSVSFTVDTTLAYIPGNSVIVVDSVTPANRFEGYVSSYNKGTGAITINNIKNIEGTFGTTVVYNVNLDGIDGPTGATGPTGPTGPSGM